MKCNAWFGFEQYILALRDCHGFIQKLQDQDLTEGSKKQGIRILQGVPKNMELECLQGVPINMELGCIQGVPINM